MPFSEYRLQNLLLMQQHQDRHKQDKAVTDLIEIPKELEFASEELLGNKQEFILNLKQLHMKQQSDLVKQIKVMSQQSKKIIDDITVIEGDIDKYQLHIDQWIKKVQELRNTVQKMKAVRQPFKLKADNLSKLKEHFGKQIKKMK